MGKFQFENNTKEKLRGTKEDQVQIFKTEQNFNVGHATKASSVRACDKNESEANL